MDTYKFRARVTSEGKIQLPPGTSLEDREVEVFIQAQKERPQDVELGQKAQAFVTLWRGFLKEKTNDPEQAKHTYLKDKHQ